MNILYPLSKDGLQLNRRVREHILGTTQSAHRVIVDIESEAMEAKENTDPIEMGNNSIAVT